MTKWDSDRSTILHRQRLAAAQHIDIDTPRNKRRMNRWTSRGLPLPTRAEPTSCELCGQPFGAAGSQLDHCHATNTFRGWLCKRCNTGLGLLGDDLESVLKAVKYLKTVTQSTIPANDTIIGET